MAVQHTILVFPINPVKQLRRGFSLVNDVLRQFGKKIYNVGKLPSRQLRNSFTLCFPTFPRPESQLTVTKSWLNIKFLMNSYQNKFLLHEWKEESFSCTLERCMIKEAWFEYGWWGYRAVVIGYFPSTSPGSYILIIWFCWPSIRIVLAGWGYTHLAASFFSTFQQSLRWMAPACMQVRHLRPYRTGPKFWILYCTHR